MLQVVFLSFLLGSCPISITETRPGSEVLFSAKCIW